MDYKAFVSSTFEDLKDHRARVIDALRKGGITVDPMEDWTADGDEPRQLCVDRICGCDFCILLVGARRGHRPENETQSITQLEYKEAVKRGIDVLVFLYDGESPWPPKYYELEKDEELKKWRDELKEHKCAGTFTHDPASIEAPVRNAILRWLQKLNWPEVRKVYLETLRDTHASIRFLGIGYYREIQDRRIEELFVDPRTAPQHISPDTLPSEWPKTSPLLEVISQQKRLVLLGDPGSGKSTIVSWIAWNLAREGENKWKLALKKRIPFVMILRDLSLTGVRTWNDLLAAFYQHWTARMLGHPRYAPDVLEIFESGRAIIMLDGLDEVGNQRVQKNLRNAVWEGMRRYDSCCWLLTSRLVGYIDYHEGSGVNAADNEGHSRIQYATLEYIAPFTDGQVKQFASNWYAYRDQSALRANQESDNFFKAINANPYTLRLARTPNLLTMMALIHRERASLPHGRALLYTDIANAYLQSIDENRRIERLGYTLRAQKQWLGRIGFEMQLYRSRHSDKKRGDERKEILIDGHTLRKWLLEAMRNAGQKESTEAAADAFIDEICRRSGLLLPRGEDLFAFTHLSFQEFFAAVFLLPQFMLPPRRLKSGGVNGAGHDDLHSYTGNSIWQETLVFLVELMHAEHPEWLEDLLYCLFGENFCDLDPSTTISNGGKDSSVEEEKRNSAILLARLAIDPHAGLAECELKPAAIDRCCHWEAFTQKRDEKTIIKKLRRFNLGPTPETLRILLGNGLEEQATVWEKFTEALWKANVRVLSLCETSISDLSALSGLTCLRVLDLRRSKITDLSSLSPLTGLRSLDLRNTQVRDLALLAPLTGLKRLYLGCTRVGDLAPLTTLTGLQSLYLRYTQVRNLEPLASLTGLQRLYLDGTRLGQDHIKKMKKTLSNCHILGHV